MYFTLLLIILVITLSIPSLSANTLGTFAVTKQFSSWLFFFTSISNFSAHCFVNSPRSNSLILFFSIFLSYFDNVSKSCTRFSILSALSFIIFKKCFSVSLSSTPSNNVSEKPFIDVIGVFNS